MTIPPAVASNKYARSAYLKYISALRFFAPADFVGYSQLVVKKTSNKLYALGSGSSICNYTEEMWNKISTHDSIGFNFFCLHRHVPNIYVSEASLDPEIMSKIFFNFDLLKSEYKCTVKLWKEDLVTYAYRQQVRNIGGSYVKTGFFNASSEYELSHRILKLLKTIQTRRESSALRVYSQGSTLDWIIDFALLMGYEELVLCGFDLKHSLHFYHSGECSEVLRENLLKPTPSNDNHSIPHATNDPARCTGGIDAMTVVKAYKSALASSSLIIYSALHSSALSSILPCYDWKS